MPCTTTSDTGMAFGRASLLGERMRSAARLQPLDPADGEFGGEHAVSPTARHEVDA